MAGAVPRWLVEECSVPQLVYMLGRGVVWCGPRGCVLALVTACMTVMVTSVSKPVTSETLEVVTREACSLVMLKAYVMAAGVLLSGWVDCYN